MVTSVLRAEITSDDSLFMPAKQDKIITMLKIKNTKTILSNVGNSQLMKKLRHERPHDL